MCWKCLKDLARVTNLKKKGENKQTKLQTFIKVKNINQKNKRLHHYVDTNSNKVRIT